MNSELIDEQELWKRRREMEQSPVALGHLFDPRQKITRSGMGGVTGGDSITTGYCLHCHCVTRSVDKCSNDYDRKMGAWKPARPMSGAGEPQVTDRLRELARQGAGSFHWHQTVDAKGDTGGWEASIGHKGTPQICPHPYCVLVREAATEPLTDAQTPRRVEVRRDQPDGAEPAL